jgi:hypothetical protein
MNHAPDLTMPAEVRASIRHTLSLYGLPEARHALAMLEAGRVDGWSYAANDETCGCLIGTLTAAREPLADGAFWPEWLADGCPALGDVSDPDGPTAHAQQWFTSIHPGHTPANNAHARLAHAVIAEWAAEQVVDLAPRNPRLAPEATAQAVARLLKEA